MTRRLLRAAVRAIEEEPEKAREYPMPVTTEEYTARFRKAADAHNPLSLFASEAASQLDSLRKKQYALKMMLGTTDHPFYATAKEAEAYLLANSKKILFRLLYCDLSDPEVRAQHADYLRERLTENAVVLHDFERLNIEVSQMEDENPVAAPRLDILADTLQELRGGQPDEIGYSAAPQYAVPQYAVPQQAVMHQF